jgi:hypothetical protein
MARTNDGAALDLDQAAVMRRLVAAFGVEHVTVTDIQPIEPTEPAPTEGLAWQATLLEEPS